MTEPNPSNYSYNCVKCGNCCREGWYVPILEEDLLVWEKSGKTDFHEKIQIDPRAISIIGINFDFDRSDWDEDFISRVKKNEDKCNGIIDTNKLKKIYDFVFDNHDYIGEGRHRDHPVLGDIYSFPKPYELS